MTLRAATAEKRRLEPHDAQSEVGRICTSESKWLPLPQRWKKNGFGYAAKSCQHASAIINIWASSAKLLWEPQRRKRKWLRLSIKQKLIPNHLEKQQVFGKPKNFNSSQKTISPSKQRPIREELAILNSLCDPLHKSNTSNIRQQAAHKSLRISKLKTWSTI